MFFFNSNCSKQVSRQRKLLISSTLMPLTVLFLGWKNNIFKTRSVVSPKINDGLRYVNIFLRQIPVPLLNPIHTAVSVLLQNIWEARLLKVKMYVLNPKSLCHYPSLSLLGKTMPGAVSHDELHGILYAGLYDYLS